MKTLRLSPVTRLWSAVGKTRRVWWPGELQLIRSLMCFALMKQVGGSESIIFHPGIIFFNTAVWLKQNWNFKYFGAFWLSNLSCTDAAAQMRTTTDSPLSSSDYPEQTYSPSTTASLTRNMPSSSSFTPSPSSSSSRVDTEVESALFISSTKDCFGGLCLLSMNLSYINKTLTDCFFLPFSPQQKQFSSHQLVSSSLLQSSSLYFWNCEYFPHPFLPHCSWHCWFCDLSLWCFILSQKEEKCNECWH